MQQMQYWTARRRWALRIAMKSTRTMAVSAMVDGSGATVISAGAARNCPDARVSALGSNEGSFGDTEKESNVRTTCPATLDPTGAFPLLVKLPIPVTPFTLNACVIAGISGEGP